MLRYRLIFGTLMVLFFVAVIIFDAFLDGSLDAQKDNAAIQATLLVILLAALSIPACMELSKLIATTGGKVFTPLAIVSSLAIATAFYWAQFSSQPGVFLSVYFPSVLAISLLGFFMCQAIRFGNDGVITNCGASCLTILYLGILASFLPAIRISFGLWPFLMFIFVVKCSDIGAYTLGRLFGKHPLAPKISPKKTWEGMAGAVLFAVIASLIFARKCDIMPAVWAVVFGVIFAFLGQMGDLVESMMKRDAAQKDSANSLPGFGGVLDVIDSPIATSVFAYLFFLLVIG